MACNYGHIKGVDNKGVAGIDEHIKEIDNDKPLATQQMSMKHGLKTFGEDGMKAINDELQQLHDREVMKLIHKKDLMPEQRGDSLGYLMFVKCKCKGKVKGRGCTDGRKQREWTNKVDLTSPTVATEAVFLPHLKTVMLQL